MSLLETMITEVGLLSAATMAAARERQGTLTKPPGSLGRLEELAIWLAGVREEDVPRPLNRRAIVVLAADHGVVRQGVSAYPAEVTGQMIRNFAAGGAAVNALARNVGARVVIGNLGVAGDLGDVPGCSTMPSGQARRI